MADIHIQIPMLDVLRAPSGYLYAVERETSEILIADSGWERAHLDGPGDVE